MDSVSFLNSLLDKIDSSSSSSSKDVGHVLHHTAVTTTSDAYKPIAIRDHMNKDSNSNDIIIKSNNLHLALPHRSNWFEYYDSASGMHYYHDRVSNTTTWDKPADFEKYFTHNRFTPITFNNTSLSSSSSSSTTTSSSSSANKNVEVDYRVVGSFNKVTGRFTNAGPESYWDKVIPLNHAYNHMMSYFYSSTYIYISLTLQLLSTMI